MSTTTKKDLTDWLKQKGVSIVSADDEALPGLPGGTVTIILTRDATTPTLKGANVNTGEEADDEAATRRKADDAKRVQEGWEE